MQQSASVEIPIPPCPRHGATPPIYTTEQKAPNSQLTRSVCVQAQCHTPLSWLYQWQSNGKTIAVAGLNASPPQSVTDHLRRAHGIDNIAWCAFVLGLASLLISFCGYAVGVPFGVIGTLATFIATAGVLFGMWRKLPLKVSDKQLEMAGSVMLGRLR